MTSPRFTAGCFGKLPLAADYLRHHRGGSTVLEWERWLEEGIREVSHRLGPRVEETLRGFPPGRFVFPGRRAETMLLGAIGPGADRSGRLFPFSVFMERRDDGDPAWRLPLSWPHLFDQLALVIAGGSADLPALFEQVDGLALREGDPPSQDESGPKTTLGDLLGPGGYQVGEPERIAYRMARLAHRVRLHGQPPAYGLGLGLPETEEKARLALPFWLRELDGALPGTRPALFWREGGPQSRLLAWAGPYAPAAFLHWVDAAVAGDDLYWLDEPPGAAEPLPAPLPPDTSLRELAARLAERG